MIQGGKMIVSLFLQIIVAIFFFSSSTVSAVAADNKTRLSHHGELYFKDNTTNTLWTKKRSKKFSSVDDATQYLSQLNEGEFDDWRFPTKLELYNLFAIFDLKNNGDVKVRIEGKYWLLNDKGKTTVGAWEIGDGCGPERIFYDGKKGYVRAVRP